MKGYDVNLQKVQRYAANLSFSEVAFDPESLNLKWHLVISVISENK